MPQAIVRYKKIALIILLLLTNTLLVSCVHLSSETPKESSTQFKQMIAEENIQLAESLNQAAHSVSKSLYQLEKTEQAAHPPQFIDQPLPSAYGLNQKISLNWNGSIEPLIKKVCHLANFKMKTLGVAPTIPIIVAIHVKNKSLSDILHNAGLQAGKHADVVVYPMTKVIELRYRNQS